MKNLINTEIKVVGGSDLSCPKTQTSVAATVITAAATMLQALGNSMHVTAPNFEDPAQPKYQRNVGIAFEVAGYFLGVTSMALSAISAAQADCVTKTDPVTPVTP